MNEQFLIYLWSISENIRNLLIGGGVTLLFSAFIVFLSEQAEDDKDFWVDILRKLCVSGVICIFLAILVPNKNDLALVFTYPYIKQGAEKVVQSGSVKKLCVISTKYLDHIIKDLEN